ncbi:MAG: hypothetical protein ACO31I_09120 [Prochlorotrichaceae cyanobacterium]|jgi:hypothetical protein
MKIMKTEFTSVEGISTEDQQQILRVQTTITRVLADGCITRQEHDDILQAIYADGKVSREESRLFRLIQEKIWQGEIYIDG